MTTESDDAEEALTPGTHGAEAVEEESSRGESGGSDGQSPLPDRLEWLLPNSSDSDGDGRTGILSTYVEWHALVLGLSAGAIAAQSGRFDTIATVIGAGAVGSRAQMGLPDKYRDQARKELPYFIAGVVIGFGAARSDLLAGMGVGV